MASQKEKRNTAIQSGMDLFELFYQETTTNEG